MLDDHGTPLLVVIELNIDIHHFLRPDMSSMTKFTHPDCVQ